MTFTFTKLWVFTSKFKSKLLTILFQLCKQSDQLCQWGERGTQHSSFLWGKNSSKKFMDAGEKIQPFFFTVDMPLRIEISETIIQLQRKSFFLLLNHLIQLKNLWHKNKLTCLRNPPFRFFFSMKRFFCLLIIEI